MGLAVALPMESMAFRAQVIGLFEKHPDKGLTNEAYEGHRGPLGSGRVHAVALRAFPSDLRGLTWSPKRHVQVRRSFSDVKVEF